MCQLSAECPLRLTPKSVVALNILSSLFIHRLESGHSRTCSDRLYDAVLTILFFSLLNIDKINTETKTEGQNYLNFLQNNYFLLRVVLYLDTSSLDYKYNKKYVSRLILHDSI